MNLKNKLITLNVLLMALTALVLGFYDIYNTIGRYRNVSSNFRLGASLPSPQLSYVSLIVSENSSSNVLHIVPAQAAPTDGSFRFNRQNSRPSVSLVQKYSPSGKTLKLFYFDFSNAQVILLIVLHVAVIGSLIGIIIGISRSYKKQIVDFVRTIESIKNGSQNRLVCHKKQFQSLSDSFNLLLDRLMEDQQHLKKNIRRFNLMTQGIPCGIVCCHLDERYTISYMNDGFSSLMGCPQQQIQTKYGNSLVQIIYQDDRPQALDQIKTQLGNQNSISVKYRVKTDDGQLLWVLNKGKMVHFDGQSFFCCILIDITSEQTAQEKLRESEERYRIIIGQTNDIVYEWNFETSVVTCSEHFYEVFSHIPPAVNSQNKAVIFSNIHPDDLDLFKKWYKDTYYGYEKTQAEFRVKSALERYIWVRITAMPINNAYGTPVKVIGIIRDITKQKIEAERLYFRAHTDALTKLYNRGTFEEKAKMEMDKAKQQNTKLAFMFVDIDDFRDFNSSFGHALGDRVIRFVGKAIAGAIHGIGFAGRSGGDEFLICITDQQSIAGLHPVAQKLLDSLSSELPVRQSDQPLSIHCSIGIVVYPHTAGDYRELIKKADEALYKVKRSGKNNYFLIDSKF